MAHVVLRLPAHRCLLHFLAPGVFADLDSFLAKYGALEDAQQVLFSQPSSLHPPP